MSSDGDRVGEEAMLARLLREYSGTSKAPRAKLTQEDKQVLDGINRQKEFRKLKDAIRLQAYDRYVPVMNVDPARTDLAIHVAHEQGYRDGMLRAVDLLEELLESEEIGYE